MKYYPKFRIELLDYLFNFVCLMCSSLLLATIVRTNPSPTTNCLKILWEPWHSCPLSTHMSHGVSSMIGIMQKRTCKFSNYIMILFILKDSKMKFINVIDLSSDGKMFLYHTGIFRDELCIYD